MKDIPTPSAKSCSPHSLLLLNNRRYAGRPIFDLNLQEPLLTMITPNGPWQDDKGAKSPLTVAPNSREKFSRSR
jgi:hypothetical protein